MFQQLRKRLEDGLDSIEHLAGVAQHPHPPQAPQGAAGPGAAPTAPLAPGAAAAGSTPASTATLPASSSTGPSTPPRRSTDPGRTPSPRPPRTASPTPLRESALRASSPSPSPSSGAAKPPLPSLPFTSALSSLQRSLALPIPRLPHPSDREDRPQPPRLSRQSSVGSGTDREMDDVAPPGGAGHAARLALEDRLRGVFAIGDDSGTTTPQELLPQAAAGGQGVPGVDIIPSTPTLTPGRTPQQPPMSLPSEKDASEASDASHASQAGEAQDVDLALAAAVPLPDSPLLGSTIPLPVSPAPSAPTPTPTPGSGSSSAHANEVQRSREPSLSLSAASRRGSESAFSLSSTDMPATSLPRTPTRLPEGKVASPAPVRLPGAALPVALVLGAGAGAGGAGEGDRSFTSESEVDSVLDRLEEHAEAGAGELPSASSTVSTTPGPASLTPAAAPAPAPQAQRSAAPATASTTELDPPIEPELTLPPRTDVRSPLPLPQEEDETDEEKRRLRERLELVEGRFAEISTSFKRLQAERQALTALLKAHTPVISTADVDGLRAHFELLERQQQQGKEEVLKLQGQIRQQEDRMEELRDTHRLEGQSRSEQVDRLQKQLAESEALLAASAAEASKAAAASAGRAAEVDALKSEGEKLRAVAREEEEKRSKAISLLKTVRQKLVKAEKERDEALARAAEALKGLEDARGREREALAEVDRERERARAERERETSALRGQFEREMAGTRERAEREARLRREKYELDAIHAKAAFDKELGAKSARINTLESANGALTAERDQLFDELQMRQAEAESSRSALELAQAQSAELAYQIRELSDRLAVAADELAEARRSGGGEDEGRRREVQRLLAESEQRAELRVAELRERLSALGRERQAAEEEWTRDLAERNREVDRLRRVIEGKDREYAQAVREKRERDDRVEGVQREMQRLQERVAAAEAEVAAQKAEGERVKREEAGVRRELDGVRQKLEEREREAEEARAREQQVRSSNKTLRDELRKVQSSAALLERGRNPGVGYWSSRPGLTSPTGTNGTGPNGSIDSAAASTSDVRSRSSTEGNGYPPGSPVQSESSLAKENKNEEEVNLEYLRNVILQFLEHKEMRPNLVRVLSVILRFTPQETRRLLAKVGN
ncbi:hypothetical protein CALCODRAFT_502304 [Calocera cornea HHB12733]|uniref:GRIP domain-containing protein n=1 Tax=Calocera cornea HHB12733 TaxID=1353952 RepID=A0A165DBC2_9BASI|nr:hypothetical protein CALCODRAFT_502304 [Calocera cornea HHB12733]